MNANGNTPSVTDTANCSPLAAARRIEHGPLPYCLSALIFAPSAGGGTWPSFGGRLHGQNNHLHAFELEPPLDRVDDLVVQQPGDPRFVLENQL
jgi:hypothetical protein